LLRCTKWVFLVLFLWTAAFPPSLLHADEFRLLPSIAEKVEYNDNIFIVPNSAPPSEKIHDFISTTSGGLQLLSNTELMNLNVSARVDQLIYRDSTNLDSTDQFYKATLSYSVTPTLSLSRKGEYDRDSRPDELFYTSGLVLNALRKEVSSEGFTGNYTLTDKTLASLSYDHGNYWYRSLSAYDMTYDAASLAFVRDLTDLVSNTKGRLNFGYTRYNFTGLEVDNYEATTGFEYALHEKWTFLLDGGARYTESHFQALQIVGALGPFIFLSNEKVTSTGTAGIGTAKLSYKGETTTADLTANRDIMPAYGSLGTVERTAITFTVSRQLTYELSGSLSGGYFSNKSKGGEFAATPINYESWFAAPSLRYDFNRNMYLEGSYGHVKVLNNATGTTADRNQVMLRFFVQHAMME